MKGDLCETFKILKDFGRLGAGRMVPMVGKSKSRSHSLRIWGKLMRIIMAKSFCIQIMLNLQNPPRSY